jgi:GNAT superfamily N-acetyltransferase
MSESHHRGVVDLVRRLPEWFDEKARNESIPVDLRFHRGYVAIGKSDIVGFITLYVAEGRVNIGWLGVDPDFQRRGIGGRLLLAAEEYCRDIGVHTLATYTLGDAVDYPPYERTRAFYRKNGFAITQRSRTDNPGCPEEIRLAKAINPRPQGRPGTPSRRATDPA